MTHTTRRRFAGISLATIAALTCNRTIAQDTATPATGEWSYTDLLDKTVTLPKAPARLCANVVTAAALWDLGIQCVAVFDYTVSAYPDGDHIAWGNVDASAVVNVGDVDGNIIPEELINANVDIVFTQSFSLGDPAQTSGVPEKLADAIEEIAPVLIVTDMEPADVQVERLVMLAAALDADLDAPEVVAAREAYEEKLEEFRTVAAEKADLTALFLNAGPEELYIAGPEGVNDLKFLGSLGLQFANAEAEAASEYWESLSPEQALLYPADVLFLDVYSTLKTAEDMAREPSFAGMAAVKANQVGTWDRDYPQSYEGVTAFLEKLLTSLRTAEKVA